MVSPDQLPKLQNLPFLTCDRVKDTHTIKMKNLLKI